MKPKVLILQHEITRYNSPIYSMIGREVDLTVGYFKKDASDENVTYAKHRFETSEIWKFTFLFAGNTRLSPGLSACALRISDVMYFPSPKRDCTTD